MRYGLSALLTLLAVLLACSPAAPAPASRGAPPVAPASQSSDATYRQQVIDGARAEGQVNALLQSTWTPDGLRQLEDAVEKEYGVRLKINFTPVGNYAERAPTLLSELAANVTPSFDLYQNADANSALLAKEDAIEVVNWGALLPAGTPPGLVQSGNRQLVVLTEHYGLMMDPAVVPESDTPRSLKDLAHPRWRGKVMLYQYTSSYIPWVQKFGRDEMLATLRAVVQNGAIVDTFANEFTRFAAKEYPMVTIVASYYRTAQLRGVPARFTPLDFSYNSDHHVMVPRKVTHPNAAKLLAAVLAGPEGQRIAETVVGTSNRYYPDTAENRLEQEALALGFQSFVWAESPETRDLALSPEGEALQREINSILKGN